MTMTMTDKTLAALEERLSAAPEGGGEKLVVAFLMDIHNRMLEGGVSKLALADRMGTSRSYISQLFSRSNLSAQTMAELAAALGCSARVQVEDAVRAGPPA
ncbi:MAG: helix-turn-helix transcriptional regulator [Pseudomonadota bacterium]